MRKMRRFKQLMSEADTKEVLRRGTHGVMAIMADDDYPYAVPMNYYYEEEKNAIYFHGAKAGMREDYMKENPKVSFSVVDLDENDQEHYSTMFRSAIAFGRARWVEPESEEYYREIKLLTDKFVSCYTDEEKLKQIEMETPTCLMTAIDIEFMTGKEAIEIVRAKAKEKAEKGEQ